MKACTERGEKNKVSVSDSTFPASFPQCERYGGGTGISILLDVNVELVYGEIKFSGDSVDDSQISLVRNDEIDVLERQVRLFEYRECRFTHPAHGGFKNFLPAHDHVLITPILSTFQVTQSMGAWWTTGGC